MVREARHEHVVVPRNPEPEQKKTAKIAGMIKGHAFYRAYMAVGICGSHGGRGGGGARAGRRPGRVDEAARGMALHNVYRPHLRMASDILLSLNGA